MCHSRTIILEETLLFNTTKRKLLHTPISHSITLTQYNIAITGVFEQIQWPDISVPKSPRKNH